MHRYIYGEDPASVNDFHGIVIHELPEIELDNQTPLPLLRDIYAIRNTSFDKILDFHTEVLFKKWPPYYMVFDYTNERTYTDMMIRDFGEDRVEKVNFTAGTSGMIYKIYEMSKLKKNMDNSEMGQFKIHEIPALMAVEAGLINQEFLDAERERLGPLYPMYYECNFYNSSST